MKILVVGAGVIGVYAAHLARAGHDVTLLARGGRLEELRRSGLRLRAMDGTAFTVAVRVTDEMPAAHGPPPASLVWAAGSTTGS